MFFGSCSDTWRFRARARGIDRYDALLLTALLLLTGLYVRVAAWTSGPPFEDAAMLMRYAEHLAGGHGIVWNIGEPPVDGATDFLFLVVLAAVVKLGVTVEGAVRGIGFMSHLAAISLVYLGIRSLQAAPRLVALGSAAYLAVGPALGLIAACFGTPFFALSACVSWWAANRLVRGERRLSSELLFVGAAFVMALIRPEGVFLAVFMVAAIALSAGGGVSRRLVALFVLVFGVVGGVYFIWRWTYFGFPLPNPYYRKGGGRLHLSGLRTSILNVAQLCLPFAPAYVLGFRNLRSTRRTLFALLPVVGFTLLWVLLSDEMNYMMRFQYPILPVVLLSWPALLEGIGEDLKLPRVTDLDRRSRLVLLLGVTVLSAVCLLYPVRLTARMGIRMERDGRYEVAKILRPHEGKGYVLATTEAGILPLYSGWRTIDAWGLNDRWIAHHGGVSLDYLRTTRPHVIMFHGYFSPLVGPTGGGPWFDMVMTLKRYAEESGYILAASFGVSPYDTHYYYVRPDFPESAELISSIRELDYHWFMSGERCLDYAGIARLEREQAASGAPP